MGLVRFTVKHLLELKNISKHIQKGLANEERVKTLLINKGYELVGHRFKTPFAEVDLLFKDSKQIYHIIEVKTVRGDWQYFIGKKQRQRLMNAFMYFVESGHEIRAHLALVNESNKITFQKDFLQS